MRTKALSLAIVAPIFFVFVSHAQDGPPDCTNCAELNAWYFPDTNWLSAAGTSSVGFSNVMNATGSCDGNWLLLDTTNTSPAFLLYNLVETNSDSTTFSNLTPASGTLYLWFKPDWTSTNQGGSGPGDWANLISMGKTIGSSWWAWYLSPDGCNVYLASQTNGGSPSVYLSAPVSFLATNWYNLTLIYGPTNTALFTNGVLVTNGTGVQYLPGSDVSSFAMGSDSQGYHQARGEFSDVESYNFQFDTNSIWDFFSFISICYGQAGNDADADARPLPNAPPNPPPLVAAPHWFTGLGDLVPDGAATNCVTNSNFSIVWLTNFSVALESNGAAAVTFAIEGGSSGLNYDVFGCTTFADPATNTVWAWLGQGQTCMVYTLTNLPSSGVFLMLGTPIYASDNDGLTLAFEALVSHTSPNNATYDGLPNAWIALNGLQGTNSLPSLDPDQDGLNNLQEYLYGTKPLVSEGIMPWVGNPSGYSGIP